MSPQKTIFISYRRSDSAAFTGRIYDRLVAHFGAEAVFKDVEDIPFGVNFVDYFEQEITNCRVFLAIIGEGWITAKNSDGSLRLEDEEDFVRRELQTALRLSSSPKGLLLLPVMVGHAKPPSQSELPDALADLAHRNGFSLRHDPDFTRDMARLNETIETHLNKLSGGAVRPPAQPTSCSFRLIIGFKADSGTWYWFRHEINTPHLIVGRGNQNDLELADRSVSRVHAKLSLEGSQLKVVDLGSTNGVLIDDIRVSEATLGTKEVFHLGAFALMLVSADEDMFQPTQPSRQRSFYVPHLKEYSPEAKDAVIREDNQNDVSFRLPPERSAPVPIPKSEQTQGSTEDTAQLKKSIESEWLDWYKNQEKNPK